MVNHAAGQFNIHISDLTGGFLPGYSCACQKKGCAPLGSDFVFAGLGCGWRVWGTAVGPGSTAPPHT